MWFTIAVFQTYLLFWICWVSFFRNTKDRPIWASLPYDSLPRLRGSLLLFFVRFLPQCCTCLWLNVFVVYILVWLSEAKRMTSRLVYLLQIHSSIFVLLLGLSLRQDMRTFRWRCLFRSKFLALLLRDISTSFDWSDTMITDLSQQGTQAYVDKEQLRLPLPLICYGLPTLWNCE